MIVPVGMRQMGRVIVDVERIRKHHGGALRDGLREAVRTATRRRLSDGEAALFLAFIDEIERRAREPEAVSTTEGTGS